MLSKQFEPNATILANFLEKHPPLISRLGSPPFVIQLIRHIGYCFIKITPYPHTTQFSMLLFEIIYSNSLVKFTVTIEFKLVDTIPWEDLVGQDPLKHLFKKINSLILSFRNYCQVHCTTSGGK